MHLGSLIELAVLDLFGPGHSVIWYGQVVPYAYRQISQFELATAWYRTCRTPQGLKFWTYLCSMLLY